MRYFGSISLLAAAVALSAVGSSARAATATSLSSFEGSEEPTVLYHPSNATFTDDSFDNMTDQGGGVMRFTLRYQPNQDWWDGDRDTENDDRQRAEVKGLGTHQKTNQTFRYSFDFRTDPNFKGTSSFCHIFQIKSTDGDSGAPLVTLSLNSSGNGSVKSWSGTAEGSSTARSFKYSTNTWTHADIIVTTSTGNTGALIASINGDPYTGVSGLPLYRPDATDYRPKWGFYRGINTGMFVGTNYIEQMNHSAGIIAANDVIWNPSPTSDTAWNTTDTNNWIKNGAPGAFAAGNNVNFTNVGVGNVVIPAGGVTPGAINVSNPTGTYTISGGPIGGSGALTKTGAGKLTIASANTFTGGTTISGGTLALNGSLAGTLRVNSTATLQGSGSVGGAVTVMSGGILSPGNSPSNLADTLSVGSLILNSGSQINIELGGDADAQYDRIHAGTSVALAGTLAVTPINNFQPTVGNTFDILNFTSRSGQFTTVTLPPLAEFLAWDQSKLLTDGVLSVLSNLPGDFDHNGTVDAADYVVWRRGFGTAYSQTDYDNWRGRYGQSVGTAASASATGSASAAVPEPSSAAASSF